MSALTILATFVVAVALSLLTVNIGFKILDVIKSKYGSK